MEDTILNNEWSRLLRRFKWACWATCTWTDPVGGAAALSTVHRWLANCPGAYAAVGIQRGPVSQTHHLHVLIGGLDALTLTFLRSRWVRRGHVQLERFDPSRSGVEYLVAQASRIELLGDPQPFRPRRRRR